MHGRRALVFIAVGVACVLAVALAAYVVLTKFRPEDEIRRMLRAMSEVQTVSERSAFSWSRGEGKERVATTLYATGQLNLEDPTAIEQATKFRLFRLSRSDDDADLSGEIRTIDGTSYLTYAPPGPDIDGVDFTRSGTWISFASGELSQWGSVIPGLESPFAPSRASDLSWTPEGIVRLRDLLSRADMFRVRYDDVTELVSGHATRVIDGQVDADAVRSFLRDLIRAREDREPTTSERLVVEAQAEALERLTVRFWIGMDDHLLYRLQAAGAIPDAEGNGDDNVLVPFDTLIDLSGFNEPFDVEVPSDALPFADALRERFGSSADQLAGADAEFLPDDAGLLPSEDEETSADQDKDGLSNVLEAFYRTDPRDPDTDDDGATDGDEVLNGRNPSGTGSLFGFGLGE